MKFKPGDRVVHETLGLGTVVDPENPPRPYTSYAPDQTSLRFFNIGLFVLVLLDNGISGNYPPYYCAFSTLVHLRIESKAPLSDLKVANSAIDAISCASCGGQLKVPYPGIKHCPKCEP